MVSPNSSPNNENSGVGRGNRFGEVNFSDAVRAHFGAADISFYFFDVCPVDKNYDCQQITYIINNNDKTELVVTNQPFMPTAIYGYRPNLDEIKSWYASKNLDWPQPDRQLELNADLFQDRILVANYVALKRCRSHPRWKEFVDIAVSQRPALYLTITSAGPYENDYKVRRTAPGALRVDVITGETSWTSNVQIDSGDYSIGQIVANVNIVDENEILIKDNLFITYDGFQTLCDMGYKASPEDDVIATSYGFNVSVLEDAKDLSQWNDPTFHYTQQLYDLPQFMVSPIEADPRCSAFKIADYERKFFPILNLDMSQERTRK